MTDISLQNLKKSFGDTKVIHDLSIDIKDGELIKKKLVRILLENNMSYLEKSIIRD